MSDRPLRVDLYRMRRQLERTGQAAETVERERWLAAITPEHRAVHTGPFAMFCSTCARDRSQALHALMARSMRSMRPVGDRGETA